MTRKHIGREAVAQPLTPPASVAAGDHPLRDWTARARGSALETLRYTRFVMVMKRALPVAAAAILALVIAYSVVPRHQDRVSLAYEWRGAIHNDLAMLKPKLTGTDARGNPFTVTASAAVQDVKNPHRATLKNVEADMQFDGKDWMNATAGNGFFDMDAGTLTLGGGISLYTDSGYELHTQSADVDLKKSVFAGDQKVTGQGPLGMLSADRFHIDRVAKKIKLSGHVHMKMYPRKARR